MFRSRIDVISIFFTRVGALLEKHFGLSCSFGRRSSSGVVVLKSIIVLIVMITLMIMIVIIIMIMIDVASLVYSLMERFPVAVFSRIWGNF